VQAALAARLAACTVLRPAGFAEIDPAKLGADALADALLARLVQAIGGARHAPAAAAVAALRSRGEGTLAGAWLHPRRDACLLFREPAALAPPVAAVRGARWDNRFRLTGAGLPNHSFGPLDPAEVAQLRPLAPAWPAALLAGLPAIRYNGKLVAVPALHYPDPDRCMVFQVVFAPVGLPLAGEAVGVVNSAGGTVMSHRGAFTAGVRLPILG
jgi:tRNA(Ile)-lysidine synthase